MREACASLCCDVVGMSEIFIKRDENKAIGRV